MVISDPKRKEIADIIDRELKIDIPFPEDRLIQLITKDDTKTLLKYAFFAMKRYHDLYGLKDFKTLGYASRVLLVQKSRNEKIDELICGI
jgi:hypothetical protein